MAAYPVFTKRPYGVGEEANPKTRLTSYEARVARAKGAECCAICGRKVNTKTAIRAIVDVRICEWSPVDVNEHGTDDDMRLEYVGTDCAKKYAAQQ
jgi:hypothetical protein